MISPETQQRIRQKLNDLGFSSVRFTQAPISFKTQQRFLDFLEQGRQGTMDYLSRRSAERLDPQLLLSDLKSLIVLAQPYDSGFENTQDPRQANISRYAWGDDYHSIIQKKLEIFRDWLALLVPEAQTYFSVDAQAVLEKAWAEKSGIGWLGKHGNIIHPGRGSYFFLAVILTNLDLPPDSSEPERCGSCTRCIEICPTRAIIAPYVVDARLCISYLTIENKGPIPRELRPLLGNHVFGCDDCQELCPWNRFSQPTGESVFFPRENLRNASLQDLLQIRREDFKKLFSGSAILRAKWKGLMRNVLVAAGNSNHAALIEPVREKLSNPEPLVRAHAVWAYARLAGAMAREEFLIMGKEEKDVWVLAELEEELNSPRKA